MTKPKQLPPGITQLPSGRYQYRWRDQDNKPCKESFRRLEDAKRGARNTTWAWVAVSSGETRVVITGG